LEVIYDARLEPMIDLALRNSIGFVMAGSLLSGWVARNGLRGGWPSRLFAGANIVRFRRTFWMSIVAVVVSPAFALPDYLFARKARAFLSDPSQVAVSGVVHAARTRADDSGYEWIIRQASGLTLIEFPDARTAESVVMPRAVNDKLRVGAKVELRVLDGRVVYLALVSE